MPFKNVVRADAPQQIPVAFDVKQNPIIHLNARFMHSIVSALHLPGPQRWMGKIFGEP